MSATPTHRRRRDASQALLVVAGTLITLVAVTFMAVGGVALYGDAKKDEDGYISTASHGFDTNGAALATSDLDVDLGEGGDVFGPDEYGKVRVTVSPDGDKPLFVGIARTSQVDEYLGGVAHAEITDVDFGPFESDQRDVAGAARAERPADQRIWAAKAEGDGRRTMTWDVADGNWSVVVMNADGSPGVHAGIKAGAKVPYLAAIGWSALGAGLLLMGAAAGLLLMAARSPRPRRGAMPMAQPSAA